MFLLEFKNLIEEINTELEVNFEAEEVLASMLRQKIQEYRSLLRSIRALKESQHAERQKLAE